MREIKFRAWDTFNNTFERGLRRISVNKMVYFGLGDLDGDYIVESGTYFDEETIIMQYTGLKDKNDKEIYEGDIASYHGGGMGTIYWDNKSASFKIEWYRQGKFTDMEGFMNVAIVIGNIYENPKLLKED